MSISRILPLSLLGLFLLGSRAAWAHAFPDHSQPAVGSTVQGSPTQVRIWFDGDLEPLFSTLQVKNAQGQPVSQGKGQVDPQNPRLLETQVPPLKAGSYRVFWSVIARDGHRTSGDYRFTVQ